MSTLATLIGRVRLLISRAVVALVDDARQMQEVQLSLLADEARAKAERFQHYGFTSVPLPGAEAIALSVGGSRSHLIAIAVDDRRHRLRDLQPGEVALYTDEGDCIVLRRGRIIEVSAGQHIRLRAPSGEFDGDFHVRGALRVDGDTTFNSRVTANGKRIDDTHTHGGVTPGSGVSAGVS